jgi:hypothetical protein
MTDRQENKFTMYEAVSNLLDANTAKTASMPAFATALNSFKDAMAAISEKNIQKNTATSGRTATKNQQQSALIEAAVPVAGALYALGSATEDPRLQALGNVKKGYLSNLRDTELTDAVTNIKNLADGYSAQLADYGITVAVISALDTKLTAYSSALGTKESSVSTRVAAGKVLDDIFADADSLLKDQLDRMMEMFAPTDQQFYLEYKNAREIRDLGRRPDDDDPTPPTT